MENIEQKEISFFDRKFRITEKGSSIKTEIFVRTVSAKSDKKTAAEKTSVAFCFYASQE